MRILWVTVDGLWPLDSGARLRSFHIIAELARRHRLTLLTARGAGDDPAELAARLRECEEVKSVPYAIPKQGTSGYRRAAAMCAWWTFSGAPSMHRSTGQPR